VRSKEDIFRLASKVKDANEVEVLLTDLNKWLDKEPGDIVLLEHRGVLYEKLQQYSKAINDYKKILEREPGHKQAITKIEMLSTILRYTNTDIYASPNTNLDPWME